ncbi:MAG: outer membrane beta-barrel protein [Acidiphilium sp.]|nr:outer membrane beta-barrel protein [Acidiphilium sp.]MDD4936421.1 outer membrane beta-barrel protein [Acidiphilium sp.]
MLTGLIGLFSVATASAQMSDTSASTPRFYINLGAAGILFHTDSRVLVGGGEIPGGRASVNNNATLTFDLGYFVTPNISLDVMGGFPPHAAIYGSGSLRALGPIVSANYAPAIFSVLYHFNDMGAFHPYIGPGLNYTFFMNTQDSGALSNVHLAAHAGVALTAGFDYDVSPDWAVNFAVTQLWLSTTAKAALGTAPVLLKLTANPTVIRAGLTYRW